jgi:hypothetical protein
MAEGGRAYGAGLALILSGILIVVVNAWLTPMLPAHDFAAAAASPIFIARQGLSALTALLLLFGVVGLNAMRRPGVFGGLSYLLAVSGCALLLAMEWSQLFIVHTLAVRAPEALAQIDNGEGLAWSDIGALGAFAAFSLGWTLLSVSLLFSRIGAATGAWLVIAGMFLTPALGALGIWAAAAGSVVLGLGWAILGLRLMRGAQT